MQKEAREAFIEGNYKTACEICDELLDKYKAKNPFVYYMHGKSYYHLNKDNINIARHNFLVADHTLKKNTKVNALVMRLKVNYYFGLMEYESGSDLSRAQHHFEEFLKIVKLFTSKRDIWKNMPEFDEMEKNCKEYIE